MVNKWFASQISQLVCRGSTGRTSEYILVGEPCLPRWLSPRNPCAELIAECRRFALYI